MAVTVKLDIVSEQKLKDTTTEKVRVRKHRITGLSGPDFLVTASTAVDASDPSKKIEQIGDPHPNIKGLKVTDRDFKHPGNRKDIAIAIITYSNKVTGGGGGGGGGNGTPQLVRIVRNGVLSMESTSRDHRGREMFICFSPSNINPGNRYTEPENDDRKYIPVSFASPKCNQTLEFTFFAQGTADAEIDKFQGTVNSKPFQGKPAGYWLCEEITERTEIPRDTPIVGKMQWERVYRFRGSKTGWCRMAVYRDPKSGNVPSIVNLPTPPSPNLINPDDKTQAYPDIFKLQPIIEGGQGWGTFKLIPSEDFNDLRHIPNVAGL